MFNQDTTNYWFRRAFSAYVAALIHRKRYISDDERDEHIETFASDYLFQFVADNNQTSSRKVTDLMKGGFRRYVEEKNTPEWASTDEHLKSLFRRLHEIYTKEDDKPSVDLLLPLTSFPFKTSPILSSRRKFEEQSNLVETAWTLRKEANDLLRRLPNDREINEALMISHLTELQTVLDDIRKELDLSDKPISPLRKINHQWSRTVRRILFDDNGQVVCDEEVYEDARETLSPEEQPRRPVTRRVQFADNCGKELCNIRLITHLQKEHRRASYSFEDFEKMSTPFLVSQNSDPQEK